MTLVDTSVLIDVERGQPQALEAVADLMASGQLAVSVVTVHELLRSAGLPAQWRTFWLEFLDAVEVVDVDRPAAEAAALIWAERADRSGPARRPDLGDVLIAGTAQAAGLDAITADEGFADLAGARLLRPS